MQTNLYPVKKDGKHGFINRQGQVIIDFEFDYAFPYSEGLAQIFYQGKCGFIDLQGNLVIPPQFVYARAFSEGRAAVTMNEGIGYIDYSGEIVIPPQYFSAFDFENGLSRVQPTADFVHKFIDRSGKTVLDSHIVSPLSLT
jgi:hypothetical protein